MRSSVPWLALFILGSAALYFLRSDQPAAPLSSPPTETPSKPQSTAGAESATVTLDSSLVALRRSYREETSSAKRVRLQGGLSRRLAADPRLDQLVSEVTDREAPTAYRSYLARVLRNNVHRDAELYAKFGRRLRQVVSDSTETFIARAEIARALIDIDSSDEFVNSLALLLGKASNDTEAVSVIVTLARSSHPEAANLLWAFVRSHHENGDAYPRALSAALLPLSHVEGIPLASILKSLQDSVSDPILLASVSKSLTARHHRE